MKINDVESESEFEIAYKIAKSAHDGQVDKADLPYINHVNAVIGGVSSEKEKAVAALHDVIEDNPDWGTERLLMNGISQEVVDAVVAISKKTNEKYKKYLKRVKQNSLAKAVKLSDLNHNKDLSRLSNVTQKDLDRSAKYERAIIFLKA